MKNFYCILLLILTAPLLAQKDVALDITGSKYSVVPYRDYLKSGTSEGGIKFIDTETGQIATVKLDDNTHIENLQHVKLDALAIDLVLVITKTLEKKNSNVLSTSTIHTYSHSGQLKNKVSIDQQITNSVINEKTGRLIVVCGRDNPKSAAKISEQTELIYDLKTLQKI